ncbi:MAG: hypothetical protein ACAH80_00805 [Alphaproteobacteria bacterium]
MTQAIKKHTASFAEQKIEISVIGASGKFFATCNYPTGGLLKTARLPYGKPGAQLMPARTPVAATEKDALKDMLDLLEKKLGQRPELDKK